MSSFSTNFLDVLARVSGGQGGVSHEMAHFTIAALLWAVLLIMASGNLNRTGETHERLFVWGFSLGLARETLMLATGFIQTLGWVSPERLHVIFPPAEHALSNAAMFLVAAGFWQYFSGKTRPMRYFLTGALSTTIFCYLATFVWWAEYILAHPHSKFGQTWCDWLFRINASIWLALAFTLVVRCRQKWQHKLLIMAVAGFFLHEFLKIPDLATGEAYEHIYAPVRHSLYLASLLVLALVYLREQHVRHKETQTLADRYEKRIRSIFSLAGAGIVTLTPEGLIIEGNPAFAEMLGLEINELKGLPLNTLVHPNDRRKVLRHLERAATGDHPSFSLENRLLRDDGSCLWTFFTTSWNYGPDGAADYGIAMIQDISQQKLGEQKIRRLAFFDSLTGLPNRLFLQKKLPGILQSRLQQGGLGCIIQFDLDSFKAFNDSRGHDAGDALLKALVERLDITQSNHQILARLGVDEFALVLSEIDGRKEAVQAAERIQEQIAEPFQCGHCSTFMTASCGIALFPLDGNDMPTLLKNVNMALSSAKKKGRQSRQLYSDDLNRHIVLRHKLEQDLRRGLQGGQFELLYQPQVDVPSGRITGAEALIRWHHPTMGTVPPQKFISLAEDCGLICDLGGWVMQGACDQITAWRKAGFTDLRVAINLSPRQFRNPEMIPCLDEFLEKTGVTPEALEFELTESILMEEADRAIETLVDLKARGIRLAIDDFGTGFSSLSYLQYMPVDRIKIDRRFIQNLHLRQNESSCTIVETIIAMAGKMGMEIIAEGIENEKQVEFLLSCGCREMQGFYLGRPLGAEQISDRLRKEYSPELVEKCRVIPLPVAGAHRLGPEKSP